MVTIDSYNRVGGIGDQIGPTQEKGAGTRLVAPRRRNRGLDFLYLFNSFYAEGPIVGRSTHTTFSARGPIFG